MDKGFILQEIKRTTASNGGKPLGMQRFENETGISRADWYGKHWRNWGEALREAGFAPNEFQQAYDEQRLLDLYIDLIRELGRFPVSADLKIKARQVKGYPSHSAFDRLGSRAERLQKVINRCQSRPGLDDVLEICPAPETNPKPTSSKATRSEELGSVYLMKSGRFYKIGRSNAVGRRERELAIQLPEKATCIHEIRTDDPPGIEAYWHRRFEDKRKNGEWFDLTADDVRAFKRRKFM